MTRIYLGFIYLAIALLFFWAFSARAENLRIGDAGPAFSLEDISGAMQSIGNYRGQIVVLEWINMQCPAVRKHYASGHIQKNQAWAAQNGIIWLSVSAPSVGSTAPSLGEINNQLIEYKTSARTVLIDSDGEVTRAYHVHRTPEIVILDTEGNIAYRGAVDDQPGDKSSRIDEAEDYVRNALQSLMQGKAPEPNKTTAYGCPLSASSEESDEEKKSQWLLQ